MCNRQYTTSVRRDSHSYQPMGRTRLRCCQSLSPLVATLFVYMLVFACLSSTTEADTVFLEHLQSRALYWIHPLVGGLQPSRLRNQAGRHSRATQHARLQSSECGCAAQTYKERRYECKINQEGITVRARLWIPRGSQATERRPEICRTEWGVGATSSTSLVIHNSSQSRTT